MKSTFIFISLLILISKCNHSPKQDWIISMPEFIYEIKPIFTNYEKNDLIIIKFNVSGSNSSHKVKKVIISFTSSSSLLSLKSVYVLHEVKIGNTINYELFDRTSSLFKQTLLSGNLKLNSGENKFIIGFEAKKEADLTSIIKIENVTFVFSDNSNLIVNPGSDNQLIRFAKILRSAGQEGVDTYRIPGLVTTKKGTLIAVYDVRRNNSKDLQGDIDIGMSRSTDGGQTWEPMKIIIDMNNWGDKPQEQNGVGDPCIFVDEVTGTIWVAALWFHGFPDQFAWNSSGPGLDPTVTGQLIMVRSEDDGLTWSEVINITNQVKDPEWRLLLQGPGRGITLKDGTLVFPAQFRDATGMPWSTIIYSKDHGNTWNIGKGAKANTTEAQCVQLSDGSIMLNMRDNGNRTAKDYNNGRSVAITYDLGETWIMHPSSNNALPEPVCMASLISADLDIEGKIVRVLFFSNPDNRTERKNITVKASLDEGVTWPSEYEVEIYSPECFGYSCLTLIDKETLGIIYEGKKDLFFQKIPIRDILGIK